MHCCDLEKDSVFIRLRHRSVKNIISMFEHYQDAKCMKAVDPQPTVQCNGNPHDRDHNYQLSMITLPACEMSTTIAECDDGDGSLNAESTVMGVLQYDITSNQSSEDEVR